MRLLKKGCCEVGGWEWKFKRATECEITSTGLVEVPPTLQWIRPAGACASEGLSVVGRGTSLQGIVQSNWNNHWKSTLVGDT